MTASPYRDAFPVAYANWYAARLFLEAGHPAPEILRRLGLDAQGWKACNTRYDLLHFADTSWVASAFQREGLAAPEQDWALYHHLTESSAVRPEVAEPLSMRAQLAALRRMVEADPRIGPFAGVDWVAQYICERHFPTIRYVHDGRHVMADGHPLTDRKGAPLARVDPFTFRKLGERWFRDDARVYGQGETPTKLFWLALRGADPDSFAVLNERYGADKAAGYYITNRRLPTEEPGTFGIVSYYYRRGQQGQPQGLRLRRADRGRGCAKLRIDWRRGQIFRRQEPCLLGKTPDCRGRPGELHLRVGSRAVPRL